MFYGKKNLLAIKVIRLQVQILPSRCNYFTEKLAASKVINSLIRNFKVFTFIQFSS